MILIFVFDDFLHVMFLNSMSLMTDLGSDPSTFSPEASPTPVIAASPSQRSMSVPFRENHHHYRLSLVPGVGIAVTVVALMMLVVLIFLIRRKSRELEDSDNTDKRSKAFSRPSRKFQEGNIPISF